MPALQYARTAPGSSPANRTAGMGTDSAGLATGRRMRDAGADPEIFHDPRRYREALSICRGCPAITECRTLADAAETVNSPGRVYGVYAGELPNQRITRRKASALNEAG